MYPKTLTKNPAHSNRIYTFQCEILVQKCSNYSLIEKRGALYFNQRGTPTLVNCHRTTGWEFTQRNNKYFGWHDRNLKYIRLDSDLLRFLKKKEI